MAATADPTTEWVMTGNANHGRLLFVRSCSPCHGRAGDGKGIVRLPDTEVPDLRNAGFLHSESAAEIYCVIRDGGAAHGLCERMLPVGQRLGDHDLRDLAAFVARLPLISYQERQRAD